MTRGLVPVRASFITAMLLPLAVCGQNDPPSKSELEHAVKIPELDTESSAVNVACQAAPQRIYRPDDRRPRHDNAKLAQAGIHLYESKRLKLYTDIDRKIAKTLPPLIDQLYDALEQYFGPMLPDRAGSDFQMTGYVIRDLELFRELKLVPDQLNLLHGQHVRNEFWMRDQTFDYYRRHLLIHEATHCFMTFPQPVGAPVWYMEGMAEHFGTHRFNENGQVTFRVMPTTIDAFAGFDRITTVRDDITASKFQSISSIGAFRSREFLTVSHYGWSWALCAFLDGTPRYHERFQKLGGFTEGSQFEAKFRELFAPDLHDLTTEWTIFANNLQFGYDLTRAAIDFQDGTQLSEDAVERSIQIKADRGWQSSRVKLESDLTYEITATGRFTLADQPKPWVSEPQGVSIQYFDRRPLGMLVGAIRADEAPAEGTEELVWKTIPIGRGGKIKASQTGTLYLRLNDAWNSLADNQGQVDVVIRRLKTQ